MQRPARGADPAARVQRDRHQQDGVVPVPHARLRLVVERTEFANGDTQQRQQVLVQREADRGTHDLKGGIVRHRSDVRVPQVAGHLRARLQARGALPGEELLRSGLAEAGAVGGTSEDVVRGTKCAASVEPSRAIVEAVPPVITCWTASKYPVPTNCWCFTAS